MAPGPAAAAAGPNLELLLKEARDFESDKGMAMIRKALRNGNEDDCDDALQHLEVLGPRAKGGVPGTAAGSYALSS